MSIHDERDLRDQLGAALGGLAPGPLPLTAVVRQGRMVMVRRRVAVAACVAVLAAAGVVATTLAREIGKPGPAGGQFHVTVQAPGRGAPPGLIATGRLGKLRWRITGKREGPGHRGTCLGINGSFGCTNGGPDRVRLTGALASLDFGIGRHPEAFTGSVRGDVTRLRLDLSNGQAVNLFPVKVFGQRYAGYIGIVLPRAAVITRITGYAGHREIGYEIPFTKFASIVEPILLKPGQPALPRPHTYLIGSGKVQGRNWKEHLYIGPWGSCVGHAFGGGDCVPAASRDLVGDVLVRNISEAFGTNSTAVAVFAAAPQVSYLRISPRHGADFKAFTVRLRAVAGARMCAVGFVASARWTAYSADGTKLDSGNL